MITFELKNEVRNLHKSNYGYKNISKITGLSRDCVKGICVNPKVINPKKRGPKNKIDKKACLRIKRCINQFKDASEKVNSRKIKYECNLMASRRTIRRYLQGQGMKFKNMKKKLSLSKADKCRRVEFAKEMLGRNHHWEITTFTDEKYFSLDGPDDWQTYVYENEKSNRIKRQARGGGVMIWIMMTSNGLLSWKILNRGHKSDDYVDILKNILVPMCKFNYGNEFYLQQDNAPVHKSRKTTDFIESSGINVITWPPRSPDINIAENIWKCLEDIIYDGPVINNKCDLIDRITDAFYHMNCNARSTISGLFDKIRFMLCKVIQMEGNIINK